MCVCMHPYTFTYLRGSIAEVVDICRLPTHDHRHCHGDIKKSTVKRAFAMAGAKWCTPREPLMVT